MCTLGTVVVFGTRHSEGVCKGGGAEGVGWGGTRGVTRPFGRHGKGVGVGDALEELRGL